MPWVVLPAAAPWVRKLRVELESGGAPSGRAHALPHTSSKDPAAAEAAQNQAAATLAALGGAPITGLSLSSFAATQAKAITLLAPYFEAERERLLALLVPIAKSAAESLKLEGCVPESYYCEKLGKDYYQAFGERVQGRLKAFDFWGNAYAEGSQ